VSRQDGDWCCYGKVAGDCMMFGNMVEEGRNSERSGRVSAVACSPVPSPEMRMQM
jgi:hypothetical protein